MDKNIKLNTSSIIFFVLNIIILLSMLILRNFYINIGYNLRIVNIIFIINIIILLLCIAFNIYLLIRDNIQPKKIIILAILILICYVIANLCIVSYFNKKHNDAYYETTKKLISFCKDYSCNKFETINLNDKKKFNLEKLYIDYNDETQLIKINIIYDKVSINEINIEVYSSNESYSSYLIKEQLILYLSKFNIEIDEESINEAFNRRDNEKVTYQKQVYEVKSIYKDKSLCGFKTIIKISL